VTASTHAPHHPGEAHDADEFRFRVQRFLQSHVAPRVERSDDDEPEEEKSELERVAQVKAYQAALFDAGLAGISWPKEYGGAGLTMREQQIFNEVAAGFEIPQGLFPIGLGMCAPTLLAHGTEEQKLCYLPKLLRGDEVWCQLFSEPGAGSDLASIQSRATRDGGGWVLQGQKVWSSVAHHASFGICLARTNVDVPKHRGLTMFILDMHAPGVTVRPLKQMNGAANFNEVFFDDVFIPAENLLGEIDGGWTTAHTTLMNERVAVGSGGPGQPSAAKRLVRLARERGLAKDPVVRQHLADLYIRETVLGLIGGRTRAAARAGRPPGPEGSIGKLVISDLQRRAAAAASLLAGPGSSAWDGNEARADRWAALIASSPALGIGGGTDEIMRNIVGERVLGLPREPSSDRDIPFRDLKVGTQRVDRAG
jgi:alkylation response protein AidB-like acyl-CoA dehydrogenase